MGKQVVIAPARTLAVASRDGIVVPRAIADAGEQAARRFLEFFAATIRNKNTRMAYYRAVRQFFAWCDRHRIGELADIEPLHVAAYIEGLQQAMAKPTVKQHLAAIRRLFDFLVVGPTLAATWRDRLAVRWRDRDVWIVSRDGLVAMKRLAGRPQDLADIAVLEGRGDDEA